MSDVGDHKKRAKYRYIFITEEQKAAFMMDNFGYSLKTWIY